MENVIAFQEQQLNRIFPFYLLIDQDLVVQECGETLAKLYPGIRAKAFGELFTVTRPQVADPTFATLRDMGQALIVLTCHNERQTALRGQIEWLEADGHLLFMGSPWFGSIEEVVENKLSLKDFAFHDPMIDLLHVLKTQEITTDDLKQLLKTVNKQKNDLKEAAREIEDIALFTTQNPDPLIRIDLAGTVIRQNPSADQLTHFDYAGTRYSAEALWQEVAAWLDINKDRIIIEAEAGAEIYSFVIKPLPEHDYYNIYGRKVTAQKRNEVQLQILSSIAAQNTHGVVIADSEGRTEWVNASFEQITGYSLEEIKGKKPGYLLQGPETDPETIAYLSEQIAKGEPFNCEILNYSKAKKPYWLRIQGQALRDDRGNITKYFAIEQDITVEKRTQERIREFEDRFRLALEKIGDYVWEHDFTSGTTRFSKRENHFIGLNTAEIESNERLWWDSVLPEDRHLLAENDRRYRAGQLDNHALEYRMQSRDGSVKWVLDRGVVIEKDALGKPLLIIGTHTDITRQKTLELKLGATANRLTSLIENLYSGVLLENEDRTIGLVNQQFCDLFGIPVPPDQLINADCSQAAEQSKHLFVDPANFLERVHAILSAKELVVNEQLEMVDGRHFQRDFIPIWNDSLYSGHLWLYTDITEQINAEQKLEQQRIFYERILNNMPADIAVFDSEHRYLFLNPQAIRDEELRGWMVGKKDEDYVARRNLPASIVANRRQRFNVALETKELHAFEEEIKKPEGSSRYILRNLYPVLNNREEVELVVGYGLDITPLKEVQHQIRESEKRYRDVIDNSLALITTHDLEGRFLSVNPMVGKVYGYQNAEIIGQSITDFLPEEDRSLFYEQYLGKIKTDKQDSGILRVRSKSGKMIYTLYNNFLKEEPGQAPYVIAFAVDITERIQAEKELRIAKKETEALAQAKQNFLANMSHEIRTPMNAIIGMSNQLAKTNLSGTQQFYLNTIHTAANNLLVIINDILDLSKIEAGKLMIEEIAFEPRKVVANALQVLLYKAEEKGIELKNSFCDDRLANVLVGDPYRLNQILLNLISNAIKFTEKGSVKVTCEVLEDKAGTQVVRAQVIDTGVGMDAGFLEKMFKKFSQADVSVTRRVGGTGLGMAITQSLLQLMNGTIEVSSEKGVGTTVSITVELRKGTAAELPRAAAPQLDTDLLAGRKVLIVDDNDMNRLVASTILEHYAAETIEAENGQLAVDLTRSEQPEIVLMDLQMPVLNGIEATQAIRAAGNNVPIIALTANAIRGENLKCFEAGMDDYLAKPYQEEELLHKLVKWLRTGRRTPGKAAADLAVAPPPPEPPAELYDLSGLEAISRGNTTFVEKMLRLFCDQAPDQIRQMQEAHRAGDLATLGGLAHKMKPSIDNLKISTIQQDIRTLEKAGKAGVAAAGQEELLRKIESVVGDTVDHMRRHHLSR